MSTDVTLGARYAPSPGIVASDVEGQVVILPLTNGIGDLESEIYSLTWSGRVIWDLLDGKRTLQDIVNKLFPEFDAPVEELEGDVTGFVVELLGRGMLVEVSG